ncbi:MAG: tyrosine--tRNA ligase [Rhodobacteraceae bacterium]|nr:tyrosine--tRNA ligase [Paracoccaceae bacterium]
MTTHIPPAATSATKLKSEALQVLLERGLVHQCTDLAALDAKLSQGTVTAYAGFDATANSLHVGHLMPLMTLRWLQRLGHQSIVVLGGGTSQVGDPSFQNEARPVLEQQQIAANIAGIKLSVERLLGSVPDNPAMLVDNAEWLNEFRFLEFLGDFGKHFTVNRMMTFDSVKSRLDAQMPLTILEFCYMMLQAVDFLELSRRHGCELQIGGSDQWGNIINGVDLGRKGDGRQLFGLTVPLVTTSSGAKMGKTAAGAVWLHPERLSPSAFWQFWRNTDDADVPHFLRFFTELPMDQIVRLSSLQGAELNEAKKILATEVTTMIHGVDAARHAMEQGEALFRETGDPVEPTHVLPRAKLPEGLGLLELIVAVGFAGTNSDARRLVEAGGVRLNGQVVDEPRRQISSGDLRSKDRLTLAVGRRRKALVGFE